MRSPSLVRAHAMASTVALITLGCAALTGPAGPALAANTMPFMAHQAIYDLSLAKSRRSPSVDSVRGRIVYDFAGSACEGFTTEFRQVSQIESGDGNGLLSDLRSTSWEEATGKSYRFKIETRSNDTVTSAVEGTAERSNTRLVIKLTKPVAKTVTFDADVAFPTEQIRRIVVAAREGKSLLQLTVYDGSDTGEKVYSTLTVIGQPIPGDRPPASADPTTGNGSLNTITRWPVTVSYYDAAAASRSGEQTPVYSMSFELYENGVSRALSLDYNDFVIGGAMTKFNARDLKPCK